MIDKLPPELELLIDKMNSTGCEWGTRDFALVVRKAALEEAEKLVARHSKSGAGNHDGFIMMICRKLRALKNKEGDAS